MRTSPEECAREILDVVPQVMAALRTETRRHRALGLSVPHFRVLAYINRHPGTSLSAVAEHIGLRLPSMSALVDGLVTSGLVTRQTAPDDRRRVTLALTARGRSAFEAARRATQAWLAGMLAELPAEERQTVARAMGLLRPVFSPQSQRATPR